MNTRFAICFLFNIRHPERSEANDFLSSHRPRPSAVEGPGRFILRATAPESLGIARGTLRRLPGTTSSVAHDVPLTPPRSFDSGSASRPGKIHLPLASAQDDGMIPEGSKFISRWLSESSSDTTGTRPRSATTPVGVADSTGPTRT